MKIQIEIKGPPRAWQRPGQQGKKRYDTAQNKAVKESILAHVLAKHNPDKPIAKPIHLWVTFFMEQRGSIYGPCECKPYTKVPDLDNLLKLIKDALNKKFWADDRYVTKIAAEKSYTKFQPRTFIEIEW